MFCRQIHDKAVDKVDILLKYYQKKYNTYHTVIEYAIEECSENILKAKERNQFEALAVWNRAESILFEMYNFN